MGKVTIWVFPQASSLRISRLGLMVAAKNRLCPISAMAAVRHRCDASTCDCLFVFFQDFFNSLLRDFFSGIVSVDGTPDVAVYCSLFKLLDAPFHGALLAFAALEGVRFLRRCAKHFAYQG
jgi:hypothetical protein